MFEIDYDDLIFLFTAMGIAVLASTFFLHLLLVLIKRLRDRKIKVTCRLCNYRFLNSYKQQYVACPNCGGINEPGKDKRL